MKRRIIVIGLGIFGANITRELYKNGFEVIAIDKNKEAVQQMKDSCTRGIVADGRDKEIIDMIGLQADDVVIISFGEDLAASTLITLNLKQLGIKTIIVKAPNEEYQQVLEKVGATEVIIPEKDVAHKVAKTLISPNVIDYLPLSDDFMLSEVAPPESFLGKSIADLQLRNKYHVEIIAVRDVLTDHVQMIPGAGHIIKDSEILLVFGKEKNIQEIQ